jgi:hypothetical protein
MQDDAKLEKSLADFFSKRFKDYTPRIGRQRVSYK